jgi:hypothetical protein
MIEPPRGILQTPLGPVNFTMTEAAHVFLHTESRNNEAITIRGIRYHVSYHCHLVDGKWTAKDYHNPYLSRKDCFNKEASQAARNTAREVLAKAWTEYLAAHPDLSRQAEQAKAAYEVEQLQNELADLESKAAAKRKELLAAKKRQASI